MNTRYRTLIGALCVAGLVACGATETEVSPVIPATAAPAADAGPVADAGTERVARLWSASCALCHVTGIGGAPHVGRADEWQPRLAQGEEVLMRHTLEGFNNMPPLGYCMACEREDFVAMIDLMTVGIQAAGEQTP